LLIINYFFMIKKIFLIVVLIFYSCHKKDTSESYHRFKKVEKQIISLPLHERLSKWDSLLNIKSADEVFKAYVYFDKSNDVSLLNKDKEAIELNKKALNIFEKYNISKMEAKTHINLGVSYAFLNKKATATDHLFKGLSIARDLKDKKTISRAYSELAHIYYLYGDKQKAVEYLIKTGKIQKKLNDSIGMSATYTNLGVIAKEEGNLGKAYEYTNKAIEIDEKMKNEIYLINSYNSIGVLTYLYKKSKEEALEYYNKSLFLAQKNHIKDPFVFENLSNLYESEKKLDSAIYFMQKAIAIGSENISDNIRLYNKLLYLTLENKGEREALQLLKMKDSLTKKQRILEQEENKKNIESNIILLNKQKQLAQAKQINKKNRIIFIFIILTFILGILISYQLNRFDKLKYKQEKYILEQKVLRSQMNPHFIFNVLSSIQNSLIENNPIKSATYLSKFAQLIRQNFDYVQRDHISISKEIEVLKNYLDTQKFRYKDKFEYNISIDDNIDQNFIQIPPMILQPFVENAIEHGFKNIDYKGKLNIHIYKKAGKICFEITDNGTGYFPKPSDKEHALDIFKRRLEIMGKEELDSYKITNLPQGTKVEFCFAIKE